MTEYDEVDLIVDGIRYEHPWYTASVYIRPMIQIYDIDARLCPMVIRNNTPKGGLMESEVDDKYVEEYWER